MFSATILSIHPKWPIEEYANNGRRCVWLIPINPPVNAFNPATISIVLDDESLAIVEISDNGAIFCHVDKIRQFLHEIEDIIDGYQKWHGNAPSFSNSASKSVVTINVPIFGWNIITEPASNINEPKAWTRKYFVAASVSWFDLDIQIIGRKDNMLISNIIHAVIQLGLIRVMTVLPIIVIYILYKNGDEKNIKVWTSWTPS